MNDAAAADQPGASLAVLGPEGYEILAVNLDTSSVTIGRERHNDIVLGPDPSKLVSREHCVIERVDARWRVRDLNSRNHVYVDRVGQRARVDRAELIHGDAVCIKADDEAVDDPRHWRIVFSDPEQTHFAHAVTWLQHYPASGTVWVIGGLALPRRVDAPPKSRRMLLFMLARYRELDEPGDGVAVSLSELKSVLWQEDEDPQQRTDSAVAHVAWALRSALGDDEQCLLQTVRDEGYRLIPVPKQ